VRWVLRPSQVAGTASVPGDKSLAHRALMLAAVADGESVIAGVPDGADVMSTVACLRTLGADVTLAENRATVHGGLRAPVAPLNAGNSGTTMRLLAGILAGRPFSSCLAGDDSLSRRPMQRVVEPLARMGAEIETSDGHAPVSIRGRRLTGIRYRLPVASAQVKSAVLLAGLDAEGETTVSEPIPTRDHTERLLSALGLDITLDGKDVTIRPGIVPGFRFDIPGDPSSAAFAAAAALLSGGEVTIRNVSLNTHRLGFFRGIQRMGADVEIRTGGERLGEPVGDIRVSGRVQSPLLIEPGDVPSLIDEIPLLALLATQAEGRSVIRGARELRVKETDRILAVAEILGRLDASIVPLDDGFVIDGPSRLRGATIQSHGDHRLAMMGAVAGMRADGETVVNGVEVADVSYPGFAADLHRLGGTIDVG